MSKINIMVNKQEENNSMLKACGYCLKIFKTNDKNKVGCCSCEEEVDKLIRQGILMPFIPKTLWERIKELEEKVKRLERNKNN